MKDLALSFYRWSRFVVRTLKVAQKIVFPSFDLSFVIMFVRSRADLFAIAT
jgi:hypothetical protein